MKLQFDARMTGPACAWLVAVFVRCATAMEVGVCEHLVAGEPIDESLDMAADIGAQWIRTDFHWSKLEPSEGLWNFETADRVVEGAKRRGIKVLAILDYSNSFATPAWEHVDKWTNYVHNVVGRYGGKDVAFEVWNEPNLNQFWRNPNPTNYVSFLSATYKAVKSVDVNARVAIGGFSQVPLEFIEEIYRLGGADAFDIMNVHPYSWPAGPERKMERDIGALRSIMDRYGDGGKPVWFTELGWPTHVRAASEKNDAVDEETQARHVYNALKIARRLGVDVVLCYELKDGGRVPDDPEHHFGLFRRDGTPKPAALAFGKFAKEERGAEK